MSFYDDFYSKFLEKPILTMMFTINWEYSNIFNLFFVENQGRSENASRLMIQSKMKERTQIAEKRKKGIATICDSGDIAVYSRAATRGVSTSLVNESGEALELPNNQRS